MPRKELSMNGRVRVCVFVSAAGITKLPQKDLPKNPQAYEQDHFIYMQHRLDY